ncbi:hypothetical protein Tco_0506144 [Tanacetum coccineum]
MEDVMLLTTRNKTLIPYYDKHGVPPTKRLFKVAMLDPSLCLLAHWERLEIWDYQLCAIWKNLGYSEWSTPAGLKLARENLQSRVKEEDSITDVENAIFDLGVMDSLCQSLHALKPNRLCARAQSVDDMPFRTLACTECTRWVYLVSVGRPSFPEEVIQFCPEQENDFRPTFFKNSLRDLRLDTSTWPTVFLC